MRKYKKEKFVDDFLSLAKRDLRWCRLLVLVGKSGSGKSTTLRWLVKKHQHLSNRNIFLLPNPQYKQVRSLHCGPGDLVLVDEVLKVKQLWAIAALVRSGATVLVASHVATGWFKLFAPFVRTMVMRTDDNPYKIARYLEHLELEYTEQAIEYYCDKYKATYTDLDLILERFPEKHFDRALLKFERFCELELVRQ